MRGFRGRTALLTALVASATAAALVAPAGAHAAPDILLKVQGVDGDSASGDTSGCGGLDLLCWSYRDSGTATCEVCVVGAPTSAVFSTTWRATAFRNDPCRAKSLLGRMQLTWSDASVSTASLSGRFVDGKPILAFSGSVDGSSGAFAGAAVSGVLAGYETDLCVASTSPVSGAMTLALPSS